MDLLSILILGAVQGIAEWLPISSKTVDTAVFLQMLNGSREAVIPLLLYLHLGTFLAALVYFRSQLIGLARAGWQIVRSAGKNKERQNELLFFISALFGTGIIALPLLWLSKTYLANLDLGFLLSIMGIGLIVTALLLHSQKGKRAERGLNADRKTASAGPIDGLMVGLMQGLSVLPGLSRSGVTTTALIWRGFDAMSAFELSFILSIPTVFCAEMVLWGYQLFADRSLLSTLAVGDGLMLAAVSAVFGYLTIGALLKLARRLDFSIIAGAFGLLMLAAGFVRLG